MPGGGALAGGWRSFAVLIADERCKILSQIAHGLACMPRS